MCKSWVIHFVGIWCLLLFVACSPTRHVKNGEYLLNRIDVKVDNKEVKASELKPYIVQKPNHRSFGLVRLPLFFYNLSGQDTSKWINRLWRRIGTPPEIFDEAATQRSCTEMERALSNRGYIHASVKSDTVTRKKKIAVAYQVTTNKPYHIEEISYHVPNREIADIVLSDSAAFLLKKGKLFDRNTLDEERQRITTLLRNKGYYSFTKEYITYFADTTLQDKGVDLELNILPLQTNEQDESEDHATHYIRNVYFVTDYVPGNNSDVQFKDTVEYNNYYIIYGDKKYISKQTLTSNCFIRPGFQYTNRAVDNTYAAFGRLSILKYVNILFSPVAVDSVGSQKQLDCYIMLTEGKSQTLSFDVEGTNSAGDLGFALGTTYQHRNIFKGSETFTAKFRVAYESISGNLGGIINNNYSEVGGEIGISYPKFMFPVLKQGFKQRVRATTEFTLNINYQQRPEYTRIIAGTGWRYKWNVARGQKRHNFDLLDISYIYLPKTSDQFMENLDSIAYHNPLLRNSYENHFIMRSSYVFYRTNLLQNQQLHKDFYTLRAGGEIAGNLLHAATSIAGQEKNDGEPRTLLGIRYAQYAKADIDYSYTFVFDDKNSLAMHMGVGVAVPYGNSEMLPFEKRYFGGGANSVRGWSVRTLGPGSYKGQNAMLDFMNQCGDIRLDMNVEYRTKVIWKLQMAAFVDAGNIWTIKNYTSQPGGQFKLNTFYKEIALAYGLGIRFDFNFFLLRFDAGVKAFDPAYTGKKRWVSSHQKFTDYTTLHFAVGYPF